MKQNSSESASSPSFEQARQHIASGVHQDQKRMKSLTRAGMAFGFLAILFSLLLILAYLFAYLPKQRHLEELYGAMPGHSTTTTATADGKPVIDLPFVELQLIKVISFGIAVVALATGLLAAGVLVTLMVVMTGRRASLEEIRSSLAEMSSSLKTIKPV